jgi:subtilisin family serine protease
MRNKILTAMTVLAVTALAPAGAGALTGTQATGVGRYIITLQDSANTAVVVDTYRDLGSNIDFVYTHSINGFAGDFTQTVMNLLRTDPLVTRIERDGKVTATAVQSSAPWPLDRVDQRPALRDTKYSYLTTGSGVDAYIIDTGVRATHVEFTGRMGAGYDVVTAGGTADDCNGHGTHVAGSVGGSQYGVAKAVTIHSVRVLNCTGGGTSSAVIAGIDWVAGRQTSGSRSVANLSLSSGVSATMDDAVRRTIAKGVNMVVAAGNSSADACNYSPARVPEAITVGAADIQDTRASFSNFGTCVDVFAPGASILSADYASDTGAVRKSGTSMASPHVAGAIARYLQSGTLSPAEMQDLIVSTATTDAVIDPGAGSPNRYLYISDGVVSEQNAAPSAAFSESCDYLSCQFTDQSTDSDGTIQSRSWNFGDGTGSTAGDPTHAFAAAGTYKVSLVVTDNEGATTTTSHDVVVTASPDAPPPPAGSGDQISLNASYRKSKGTTTVSLAWTGASASTVDVWRSGRKLAADVANSTGPNNGFTDTITTKGSYTFVYKVCNAGTTTCSNEKTVSF